MPSKTPIYLKPNGKKSAAGAYPKNGRKLRELLSSEMISLPLGDFRHTAHVGKGADDVFGDTTFLQLNSSADDFKTTPVREQTLLHGGLRGNEFGNGSGLMRNQSESGVGKSSARPLSEQSYGGYGPDDSPILQSAISLPMLSQPMTLSTSAPYNGPKQAKSKKTKKVSASKLPQSKTKSHETGLNCLSVAPPEPAYQRRVSEMFADRREDPLSSEETDGGRQSSSVTSTEIASSSDGDTLAADETWTFDLDLGSSLLDEVLTALNRSEIRV